MPRPWYRSRLFWLGLVPLLFLVWVWWDSTTYTSGVHFRSAHREYVVGQGEGYVGVGLGTGRALYLSTSPLGWSFHRSRDLGPALPPAVEVYLDHPEMGYLVGVAVWLLVAGFTPTWIACLIWWQRRKRRKAVASIEGP